jgi:O-succinylbenzoate synthase
MEGSKRQGLLRSMPRSGMIEANVAMRKDVHREWSPVDSRAERAYRSASKASKVALVVTPCQTRSTR